MSVVFAEALRLIRRRELPEVCERDLLAALEAGRLGLEATYAFAAASGLPRELFLRRAAAVYLGQCAGNVCDDLADDECTYFEPSVRTASIVQFILQHLMTEEVLRAEVAPQTMARASSLLAGAAAYGPVELRCRRWTWPTYQKLAETTGGEQWQAYLMLLWEGSPLASQASSIGALVGGASYVALDVASADRRLFSMSVDDQASAADFALESCRALDQLGHSWLQPLVSAVRESVTAWNRETNA